MIPSRLVPAPQTVASTFVAPNLSVIGNNADGPIAVGRTLGGSLLVNGNAVERAPTVGNTSTISVFGLGGNDVIGLDESVGALPRAMLFGGFGNDSVSGGSAADQIFGQGDNDVLDGRGGNDAVFGGTGNDVLAGGLGADQLFGEDGDDRMVWKAGDGSDQHEGGAGNDTTEVNGGAGAETFAVAAVGARAHVNGAGPAAFTIDMGGTEALVLAPGAGADTITVGSMAGSALRQVAVNLGADGVGDTLSLDGTAGDDTIAVGLTGRLVGITGLSADIRVSGSDAAGLDQIVIRALDGNDRVDLSKAFGPFGYTVAGGGGNDTLTGSAAADTLFGDDGADVIVGAAGNDVLTGGAGDDVILGGADSDVLFGDAGNDVLDGGLGDDVLVGGTGVDVLLGGGGKDVFIPSLLAEETTIRDFGDGDRLDLSAFGIVDGAGLVETARSIGDGVTLDLGGTRLTIEGIDLAAFAAGDVLL